MEILYDIELGKGGFGAVYKGIYFNEIVAVKLMEVTFNEAPYLFDEIICNLICKSENIVNLIGVNIKKNEKNI